MHEWVRHLLGSPHLDGQGHAQSVDDANLGLGWLYYALARTIRPRLAVAIGSYRGFVPLVLGRALMDNAEGGQVYFIDPSLVDDFWRDAARVREYFAGFGITNICHFCQTTQEFAQSDEYRRVKDVGLLFIDGYHTEEQAEFDFETFRKQLSDNAVVLFHDSVCIRESGIYGPDRRYTHTVKRYIDRLKREDGLQVFDLPFDSGVTLVRNAMLNSNGATN